MLTTSISNARGEQDSSIKVPLPILHIENSVKPESAQVHTLPKTSGQYFCYLTSALGRLFAQVEIAHTPRVSLLKKCS